jgi:hypothetical protein
MAETLRDSNSQIGMGRLSSYGQNIGPIVATRPSLSFTVIGPQDQSVTGVGVLILLTGEGYSEVQFLRDVEKARKPLSELADKARANLQNGMSRRFPG